MANVLVTMFTAARMAAIEAQAIINGQVDSQGDLVLTRNNGETVDAGSVRGVQWGTTAVWLYTDYTEHEVVFPPGITPKPGDFVVTSNALSPGSVYRVTLVHSPTLVDLEPTGISMRGPKGADATGLSAYPVGAIYLSAVSTSPATLFGGTWTSLGQGRTLVGVDTSQTEFNTVLKTGGAKTHTLSLAEIPNATGTIVLHGGEGGSDMWSPSGVFAASPQLAAYRSPGGQIVAASSLMNINFNLGGGGQAHNNLQPYITCYMWRRTA